MQDIGERGMIRVEEIERLPLIPVAWMGMGAKLYKGVASDDIPENYAELEFPDIGTFTRYSGVPAPMGAVVVVLVLGNGKKFVTTLGWHSIDDYGRERVGTEHYFVFPNGSRNEINIPIQLAGA